MAILLFRVDERLIHGQVVVGWGTELHPDRIIVVDDEIAGSSWEQELYALGVPEDMAVEFVTAAVARARLADWETGAGRSLLLTRDLDTMCALAAHGALLGREINIGGLHYAPGRESVLPYVFLSAVERAALQDLVAQGAIPSARDLPGARRVPADRLLRSGDEPE